MNNLCYESSITHHGVKGQRWGVRRYQNADGSLTRAGRRRYLTTDGGLSMKGHDLLNNRTKESLSTGKHIKSENKKQLDDAYNAYKKFMEPINKLMNDPKLVKKFGSEAFVKSFGLDEDPKTVDKDTLMDFVGGDTDYGPTSTVALYYKSIGVSYSKLHKEYAKVFDGLGKASENVAKDLINSLGNEAVSKISSHHNNTLSDTSIMVSDNKTYDLFRSINPKFDDDLYKKSR